MAKTGHIRIKTDLDDEFSYKTREMLQLMMLHSDVTH